MVVLLLMGTVLNVHAQKKPKKGKKEKPAEEFPLSASMGGETVRYAVLEDAPEKIKNTFIAIDYFGFDIGSSSVSIGGGIDIKHNAEKFMLSGNFFREYADLIDSYDEERHEALGRAPLMNGGFVGTFFVNNTLKEAQTPVAITSTSTYTVGADGRGGYRTRIKRIVIPAQLNRKIGIRAGYQYHQNDDAMGNFFSKWDYNTYKVPSTRSHSIVLGVSLLKARNIRIKAQNYGERANSGLSNLYADILIAPSLNSSVFQVVDYGNAYMPVDDANFAKNRVGARIGYEAMGTWKKYYIRTAYEVGVRPSLKNNLNAYMLVKSGIGMCF